MKEIKTILEAKEALMRYRSVVLFAKENCIHCSCMKNCIIDIEKQYPLIGFYETKNNSICISDGISEYPTVVFYEDGFEQVRITGSDNMLKIKEMLNLWIVKL